MYAIAADSAIEPINSKKAELLLSPTIPNGTFMPRNDEMIVGIERMIVTPARNFMMLFCSLLMIVA